MGSINAFSYAYRFWKRDIIYSLFTGLFATGIFFFLIHSLRIQINTSGVISFSSIEGLKNSPHLLFYAMVVSLAFLSLGTIFPRIADFGVMMAVGGNSWVCVQIHCLLLLLLITPGFLFGNFLQFIWITDSVSSISFYDLVMVELIAGLTGLFCILLFGIPSALLTTLRDPYASIRRMK
ncbi:MAG: hypothetical protein GW938_06850 [Leptospira sp.]|nr:hypothetical protein [Leptospira sp.]NCS93829.1 hypothetical protein [Leptospira sp.]